MVAPASLSASSSPGKPLSPHTPHTPAIPSRLSENSIIDYNQRRGGAGGIPRTNPAIVESGPSRENTITQEGTTAIDIPVSPRLGGHNREQPRSLAGDDEAELAYAHRGISGRRAHADSPDPSGPSGLQPAADIRSGGAADMMNQGSAESKVSGSLLSPTSSSPFGRRRYIGMASASAGRGQTPPQSSRASYSGTSSNRYAAGGNDDNDEYPLLFDMSEMDAASRRSLEEARGGGNAGSASSGDRAALGAARRGWS
jgi:autophagy-related protein 13